MRLELKSGFPGRFMFNLFQFHKGAIRTLKASAPLCCLDMYFNSIKVRLELVLAVVITSPILIFQFHKGAIRTEPPRIEPAAETNFNSIKVRLELNIVTLQVGNNRISIP